MSEQLLERLDLVDAPLEKCPMTYELGIKAPFGKLFRMTGMFEVTGDDNHFAWPKPLPSVDLFIKQRQPKYDYSLFDEFGGDKERIIEALKEDSLFGDDVEYNDELTEDFFGKWLMVNQKEPNQVAVKTDPHIWYERGTETIEDIIPDYPIFVSGVGPVAVYWSQGVAQSVDDEFNIELVDFNEKKPQLFVPEEDKTGIEKIFVGRPPTIDEWSRVYEDIYGVKLSPEKRMAWTRVYRNDGIPFADDPLRNFVFDIPRVLEPDKPKVLRPEGPERRWIIKPGQEHIVDKYRDGTLEF